MTTDSSGDAVAFIPDPGGPGPMSPLSGEVRAVSYGKIDFEDTVDFTITTQDTETGVWTEANVIASKTVHPLVPGSDQAGLARVYAAAGESVPAGPPVLAHERLKIVIAAGGDTKSGKFTIVVG